MMINEISLLIDQYPHLKDPLRFYGRWQQFHQAVNQLVADGDAPGPSPESRCYPREHGERVVGLFLESFPEFQEADLIPLGRTLERGEFDFMQLPLGNRLPVLSEKISEPELHSILFLLCRPYFLSLHQKLLLDGSHWADGRCPLCSARPVLVSIGDGPQRQLHCSYCGLSGPYQRFIGCLNCACEDTAKLDTLSSDGEPGFRIATCQVCMTYVKVIGDRIITKMSFDLADLVSLPLDLVAQEKGYQRLSPNPIGLIKLD